MRNLATCLTSLCFLLLPGFLLAQPANDNPCSATNLTVAESADPCTGQSYNVSTATYLPLTFPASCVPAGSAPDVWFKFTATASTVSVYYTSALWSAASLNYIQVLEVTACNGTYYLRDCWAISTDLHAGAARVVNYLTPGTVYYLRLVRGTSSDNINLCINTGVPSAASKVGINTKVPTANLDVAGTARFRDNVGIGTATPDTKLHVVGGAKITGNTAIGGEISIGSNYPLAYLNNTSLKLPATTGEKLLIDWGYNDLKAGIGYYANPAVQGSNMYFYNAFTQDNFLFGRGNPFYFGGGYFTELMRLTGDGKLGIGTAAPDAKLHIAGSIKMVDGTQADGKVLTSDAAGLASWKSLPATQAGSWTLLNNHIYNNNPGNVGIGISSPGFPLNFAPALGDKIALWGSNGAHYGFGIQSGLLQIHTDAPAADIAFGYGSSASFTETVRIKGNGNVGIGTNNPGVSLVIQSPNQEIMWLNGTNGAYFTLAENGVNRGYIGSYSGADQDIELGTHTQNTTGSVNLSTGNTPRLTVSPAGNIGIGNSSPTRPLSFPPALGEKILLYPGANGEVGIGVYGNELRLHADNPGAKVSFGTQDNNGVFTEVGKFEKNGGYGLSVFGAIWANGTTYASDARFKKNVEPLNNSLEKILQLDGVSYQMKTEEFPGQQFDSTLQVGLIAQDVEKIVPEVVTTGPNGYKAIDYAKLVPLLIEGMKAQQKEIEVLKKQVKKRGGRSE